LRKQKEYDLKSELTSLSQHEQNIRSVYTGDEYVSDLTSEFGGHTVAGSSVIHPHGAPYISRPQNHTYYPSAPTHQHTMAPHRLPPLPPSPLYPPVPSIAGQGAPYHGYPQSTNSSTASNVEQPDPHTNLGLMFGRSGSRYLRMYATLDRRIAQSCSAHDPWTGTGHQSGRLSSDSHADTCCLGRGFVVVNYTNEVVDVRAFTDKLPAIRDIPIVSAVTAYDDPTTGVTTLLHIHQALWMGNNHAESLSCPNQL
jgi:hypothetical protein